MSFAFLSAAILPGQAFLAAAAAALVLTPVARLVARRVGAVALPRADRWHRQTIALLGGVAVWLSVAAAMAWIGPGSSDLTALFASSTLMCVVGVVDDFLSLKPSTKFTAQIAAACLVIVLGRTLDISPSPIVNAIVTIGWFVWVTNAVNLLDNMDGVCAGVVCIAALAFAAAPATPVHMVAYAAAVAGACAAFLVYNFNPASIFLGDGGSLFLGASLAVLGIGGRHASVGLSSALAVPALLLVIPLFDTAFVTVSRKLSSRPASLGGRDHTSHRLVALGFSERTAALVLYLLAAIGGAAGLIFQRAGIAEAPLLLGLLLIGLGLLGLHLSRVRVYGDEDFALLKNRAYTPLLVEMTYKRRVFEVLLDFVLVTFSYYAAYVIRFDKDFPQYYALLARSLPIVIAVQLVSFFAVGVYRPVWRYFSASDLTTYVRGVGVGTVGSVLALLYLYRFDGYSRGVFIIYALMLGVLLVGSRASFRVLADIASRHSASESGAVVYGAGDAGALVVRELRNNPVHALRPLGFIDDNGTRLHRRILGVPVYGSSRDIDGILDKVRPNAVIVSSVKIEAAGIELVRAACAARGIRMLRLEFGFRELQPQPRSQRTG